MYVSGGVENREAPDVRNERRSKRFETPEALRKPWRESTVRGDNDSVVVESVSDWMFVSARSVATGR